MKLEELARQSSAAARTSVSRLDPPPIGEPQRPRWLVPAVAGVAVTALVVGGLAVISRAGDGDVPAPAATVPEVADPPRLAFGPDVEGWQAISAMSLDQMNADAVSTPTFEYYGTLGADDPFVDGDLLIGTVRNIDEPTTTEGEQVDIRGTTATLSDGTDEFGFEATVIEWAEIDDAGNRIDLVVASRRLGREAVLATVEQLTVDIAAGTATPTDGFDLDLIVRSNDLPVFGRTSGDGWLVSYRTDGDAFAVLTSAAGSFAENATTLLWWSESVEDVLVGERAALLATLPVENGQITAAARTLVWEPESGVIANLNLFGGQPDEPLWLAERVVELDPAAWSSLVDQVGFPDRAGIDDGVTEPGGEFVAEGGGEIDGVDYGWVATENDGGLCLDVRTRQSSSGACSSADGAATPTGSAEVMLSAGSEPLIWAVLIADPDVESARPLDDRFSADRFEWNGASWFVVIGPAHDIETDVEVEIVVDGQVADTVRFGLDPDAPRPGPPTPDRDLIAAFPVLSDAGHDDVVVVADGETDGLRWAIGEGDAGLCLYTSGVTDSISCNDFGGIAVFPAIAVGDANWSVVYSTHRDDCPIVLSTGTSPIVDMASDGATSVWIVDGESDGWQFGVEDRMVDLPRRTGSIEWPDDTCLP